MDLIEIPYVSIDHSKSDVDILFKKREEIANKLLILDIEVQIIHLSKFLKENTDIFKVDIYLEDDDGSYLSMVFFDSDGEEIEQYSYYSSELTTLEEYQIDRIKAKGHHNFSINNKNSILDLYRGFLGKEKGTEYYNQKKSIELADKLDSALENKTPVKSKKI